MNTPGPSINLLSIHLLIHLSPSICPPRRLLLYTAVYPSMHPFIHSLTHQLLYPPHRPPAIPTHYPVACPPAQPGLPLFIIIRYLSIYSATICLSPHLSPLVQSVHHLPLILPTCPSVSVSPSSHTPILHASATYVPAVHLPPLFVFSPPMNRSPQSHGLCALLLPLRFCFLFPSAPPSCPLFLLSFLAS